MVTWQQQTTQQQKTGGRIQRGLQSSQRQNCVHRDTGTRKKEERERERQCCRVLVCRNLQRQITYIPLQPQISNYAAFNAILESMCDSSMQNNLLAPTPSPSFFFLFFFVLGGAGPGVGDRSASFLSSLCVRIHRGLGWGIYVKISIS